MTQPKTIDTLVADIYALFGEDRIPFDDQLFHSFGDKMVEAMKNVFAERQDKQHLRMSNIGRPDRQVWYDINYKGDLKEKLEAPTLIKFAYGHMLEQFLLMLAKMAGHDVQFEQGEVEIEGIKGHLDCIIDGVVVDVKSASSYSFEKFRTGALLEEGNDPFGYLGQLSGYVEAKTPDGLGAFLVIDKTLGKLTLLKIPNDVLKQYQVRSRINHLKEVVNDDRVPVRCYSAKPEGKSGNFILPTGCSYCNHRFHCWEDANNGKGLRTFFYSQGPRYFTHVEREPQVPEKGDF